MTELDDLFTEIIDYKNRVEIIMKCIAENIKDKDEYEKLIKSLYEPIRKKDRDGCQYPQEDCTCEK